MKHITMKNKVMNVSENINKEEISMKNTIIKEDAVMKGLFMNYMKENGYLMTTSDILGALSKAEGFKSRGSKNFAAVLEGLRKGHSLLAILRDPSIVGVNKNMHHYFEKFVKNHKLANRVYVPTRKGVLVPFATIEKMELRDNKVFSTIDYSEVNTDSYKEVSESYLSEMLAGKEELIEFSRNGKVYKKRVMLPMKYVFFIDLYLDLPEEEEAYSEEDIKLIELRKKLVEEGFYYYDEHGEERHAYFFMQTASQARTLEGMFIDKDFMDPVSALKLLGNELIAFAKNKDGKYVMDVTKMLSRPGLAGTNSIKIHSINIGNIIERVGNDIRLLGGNITMRVTEDRMVEIKTGTYRMWNAEEMKFEEFNAKEHPITLTAADGSLFANERVADLIEAEVGKRTDAYQVRITPFTKGLLIIVPNLDAYYPNDDIVALQSAVKGDYEHLFKMNPEYKIQFRVAIFNKKFHEVKKYTDMPYQFVQASSLNVNDLWNTMKPHLERVHQAFYDAEIMKEYVGLDKVIDTDLISEEVEHYMIDQSRVSTFTTFLDMFPWSYQDAQMKRYALDILKEKIKDWKTGNVPVEGHYRYMIQDPYAVLEAGTKYEVRNDKGELMIINRGDYHIQPNEVYVPSAIKEKSNIYVAAGRNPMIAKGEWQVLRHRPIDQYEFYRKKGYFNNLLIMSVHDLCTFAMGGADNDGDTALTVTDETIVSALMRNVVSPVMDISFKRENGEVKVIGDGCPYSMELAGVYKIPNGLVEKQDGYMIEFTESQNTDELYKEVHRLGIDYVVRTLKPNKIGFATNIATILADAVRGIAYYVALNKPENKDQFLAQIKQYEEWIDILRLVQGWEIDAAKHGGAYHEVMKEVLDFMNNPPRELSRYSKLLNKRIWSKPDWLAARSGRKGHNFGSVLSKLMKMVQHFEDEYLTKKFEEMYREANHHSLLATLNSAFNLDANYFNEIARRVRSIKSSYGAAVRKSHEAAELKKNEIFNSNLPEHLRDIRMNEVDEKLDIFIGDLADQARDLIADLIKEYPARDIGYVAYYITYVDRKSDASLAFPWTIAREAFVQTLSYVENKEKQDQVNRFEVIDSNFNLAVCIPDAIQEEFGMDAVLKGLAKGKVFIQAKGDKYVLFINKTEVGFVFNSAKNIRPLLGHDKFYVTISSLSLGGGKRTVNLEANKLYKL